VGRDRSDAAEPEADDLTAAQREPRRARRGGDAATGAGAAVPAARRSPGATRTRCARIGSWWPTARSSGSPDRVIGASGGLD